MQFKTGLGWKACYNEETGRYFGEYGGTQAYHLYELTKALFDRLEPGMTEGDAAKTRGTEKTLCSSGVRCRSELENEKGDGRFPVTRGVMRNRLFFLLEVSCFGVQSRKDGSGHLIRRPHGFFAGLPGEGFPWGRRVIGHAVSPPLHPALAGQRDRLR